MDSIYALLWDVCKTLIPGPGSTMKPVCDAAALCTSVCKFVLHTSYKFQLQVTRANSDLTFKSVTYVCAYLHTLPAKDFKLLVIDADEDCYKRFIPNF